jgi:hypothetical protein
LLNALWAEQLTDEGAESLRQVETKVLEEVDYKECGTDDAWDTSRGRE